MFWRRVGCAPDGHIAAAGAMDLSPGEVLLLGPCMIPSVTNPIPRLAGAIHVYGGNFFDTPRSEWDAETLTEQPYDVEKNMRLFQECGTA